MKAIIIALIPILAVAVGILLGRRAAQSPGLSREDKKELAKLRGLVGNIRVKAAEHSVLGDDFAVIVLGMISDSEGKP